MKTKILLSMLASLLGAFSYSLRGADVPVLYVGAQTTADIVVSAETDSILQMGSMQQEVLAKIGNPTTKISRTHWVYANAWLRGPEAKGMEEFDTLIVTFNGQRVSGLFLIRRAALKGYSASIRNQAKPMPAEAKTSLLADRK